MDVAGRAKALDGVDPGLREAVKADRVLFDRTSIALQKCVWHVVVVHLNF